jgi:hypothetical protein
MIDGNEMLTYESFQALTSDYTAKSQLSCGSCIRKTKADPQRANEAIGKNLHKPASLTRNKQFQEAA